MITEWQIQILETLNIVCRKVQKSRKGYVKIYSLLGMSSIGVTHYKVCITQKTT